jgi:hypothetical protein
MPVALDPLLCQLATAGVALVLLVGAAQKFRDLGAFADALENYALLPIALVWPLARALPAFEALAGMALLSPGSRPWGAGLATALLLLVSAAIAINLVRGRRDIDCGCGGFEDEQHLSWALVGRNAVLLALLAASLAPVAPRALAWLDYVSLLAGAASLFGLYVLTNQLLANRPRLARLRAARA